MELVDIVSASVPKKDMVLLSARLMRVSVACIVLLFHAITQCV